MQVFFFVLFCLLEGFLRFQHRLGHISAVHNFTINYYYLRKSYLISESVLRDIFISIGEMSEIKCHRESLPCPRIEPATPGLQIR